MNRIVNIRLTQAVMLLLLFLLGSGAAQAQTTVFTYQGKLTDAGNPANGNYDLQFKLFDALSSGAQQGVTLARTPVAVSAGVFTVTLDFSATVFGGADRFLEIGVRPAGSANAYTVLAPRQQITSSPYAIQTLNAQQLGGLPASRYIAGDASGNVGIGTTPQAGIRLDVNGDALIRTTGSGGNLQIGTPNGETGASMTGATGRADVRFDGATLKLVAGPATPPVTGPPPATNGIAVSTAGNVGIGTLTPGVGASAGRLHVISNNAGLPAIYGESANRGVWGKSTGSSRGVFGESTSGEGVYGTSSTNFGVAGVSNSSSGVYGQTAIGSTTIAGVVGKSSSASGIGVIGEATTGVYGKSSSSSGIGVTGESNTGNSIGVYGTSTSTSTTSIGVYGSSTNGIGLRGLSTGSIGYGVFAQNLSGGMAIGAAGDVAQNRDKGGFVKAMIYVNGDGTIARCYNSQLIGNAPFTGTPLASTAPCGFSVFKIGTGYYEVNFGFQVNDRFYSLVVVETPLRIFGELYYGLDSSPNALNVITRQSFPEDLQYRDANFCLIIY